MAWWPKGGVHGGEVCGMVAQVGLHGGPKCGGPRWFAWLLKWVCVVAKFVAWWPKGDWVMMVRLGLNQ